MKKMIIILCSLMPALAIASLASTSTTHRRQNSDANLKAHWFSMAEGTYLGYFDIADLKPICGSIAIVDCTVGYEDYDFENDIPLSDPIILEGEYEL